MKRLLQFVACGLLLLVAAACSHGAKAVNKAFDQACEAQSAEKVAMTLCNGDIDVATLSSDEAAKLSAVLGYIEYTGMYTANFQAQVDMYEFGKLMEQYRALKLRQDGTDQKLIEDYTRQIFVNQPNLQPEK